MLNVNIRKTLALTLSAVETAAGDARTWLEDDAPVDYETCKAAVAETVDAVGGLAARGLGGLLGRR